MAKVYTDRWVRTVGFRAPWPTPPSDHSISFVILLPSPHLPPHQNKCSLSDSHFPILVLILILKDLLNHVIASHQSPSNLSYTCSKLMLSKNRGKKKKNALLWSSALFSSLIHGPMLVWLRSALSYRHQAVSLLEIFLRCHSDLVVAQEQLKVIALKVEIQDIEIHRQELFLQLLLQFCNYFCNYYCNKVQNKNI